ncbi:MAG: alpha/beta hydrolase, partial [Pseudomonadota bacterium]
MIAGRAQAPGAVERLMASTGSSIDAMYLDEYRALFSSPAHVHATLGMMARWDLWTLQERLGELTSPLTFFYGERDLTVPPHQAGATAARVPRGDARSLGALGHLAHEEAASDVIGPLRDALCKRTAPPT